MIHLHVHSHYSFLEGMASPEELARAASQQGMAALALTDHRWLTGAAPFALACKAAGVRPMLGLEVDARLPYRLATPPGAPTEGLLVLLAMDGEGWANLCRLSSLLFLPPDEGQAGTLSLEQLARHTAGLICLTGGPRGVPDRMLDGLNGKIEAARVLGALKEIYPGRLYVEIDPQAGASEIMWQLAREAGLPAAAARSIYYLEAEESRLQRTLAAIRENRRVAELPDSLAAPPQAAFASAGLIEAARASFPGALEATLEIAERCPFQLPLGEAHYPQVRLAEGQTPLGVLREKSEAGAKRLYGALTPAIQRRLAQELEVIGERGYAPIFLIAEEILSFARKAGIPTASRGSASSSLVAHCVGITTPDPLAHDLYFERFLNPARKTPPDIDTDVCSRRRDELLRHVFETYGREYTALVGSVSTFRPRSALQDTAKAYGLKAAEVRSLAAGLPHWFGPRAELDRPTRLEEGPFADLARRNPHLKAMLRDASALLGRPRHLSVHPGGVVIAPGPMTDFLPLTGSDSKGLPVTQFELDAVEEMGMIKLDLLGVRGLTVLGDMAEAVRSWRRTEFKTALDVLDRIAGDDPETVALVQSARTIGCFSIESPGMRATLKEIHAKSPGDIMAALALYRPGPMKGGLRDAFVRRHNRLEAVTHLHPALSGLLQETYGVILYQEQVLRVAHELAGLSLAEADLLRRAMSHFDPGRQMQTLKEHFIEGAGRINRVPRELAERIWEMMAAFAGYGFPKAHAASYAWVSWRSAWCKAHYPAEFIAAVLANHGGYYPQSVYLNEARRLRLDVRPPHVNHSLAQFSVSYPRGEAVLWMGLDQIRDLSHRTQERILRLRPFHDLREFIYKVDPRKEEAENLVQVGAFDGLGAIPDLLRDLLEAPRRAGQLGLFEAQGPGGQDWSPEQKVAAQQRLLGIALEAHPLDLYAGQIAETQALTTLEAAGRVGQKARVAGLKQILRRGRTEKGEWMGFLTLEDLEGAIDVILFPDLYERSRWVLSTSAIPLVVEGMVELDTSSGEPVMRAEKVARLKV